LPVFQEAHQFCEGTPHRGAIEHPVVDGATVGRALTELVSFLEHRQALGDLPA